MRVCKTDYCNNKTPRNGKSKDGKQRYSVYCTPCRKAKREGIPVYHIHKRDKCENCGFVPEHSCQLDVDHIDADRGNADLTNLVTLCSNCHRLKTHMNKDHHKSL